MPLTAAQICSLARETARCPGFTVQSGQLLNSILSDLCQQYDFAIAKKTYKFNFQPSQVNELGQNFQNFPADYLRGIRNECFYVISGVPYPMIPCELEEFDMLVQQAGLSNFPVFFSVDMSLSGMVNLGVPGVPVALFWMVPSGAYPMTVRYYSQMPDIATPETSNIVPWFPNQQYLQTALAGRLAQQTDDDRADALLSDDEDKYPQAAGVVLKKYLRMKDDKANRTQQVKLDRRMFGTSFDKLRNTKHIGWMVPFTMMLGGALVACLLATPALAQTAR